MATQVTVRRYVLLLSADILHTRHVLTHNFCLRPVTTWLAMLRRRFVRGGTSQPTPAPASILVVRLDALGDLVLTTPLFRELKRNFPGARITAVVQANYVSLLEADPHVDEIISMPRKPRAQTNAARRWSALRSAWTVYRRQLRSRRFYWVLSPRWDLDENLATLLCLLVRARERVGYREDTSPAKSRFNRGFSHAFTRCLPPGPLQHEVLRNLELVKAIGGTVADRRPQIHLTAGDREYAANSLHDVPSTRRLVAVGVGAQAPGRRWPIENYAGVLRALSRHLDIQPVILCAPGEVFAALQLADQLPVDAIIECGSSIRHTCALLERCDLFLGNDSGAAHLAAAMQCKTLVVSRHPITGDPSHPNSPARFAPFCSGSQVLQPETGREECSTHCVHTEPHCILAVSVDQVVSAAMGLLAHQPDPEPALVGRG